MTKHDSWVFLKEDSPWSAIAECFPGGLPVRDPFPMERATDSNGELVSLWIIDLKRLNPMQVQAIADLMAINLNAFYDEIIDKAIANGGFGLRHEWVERLKCGPEGMQRTKELADFLEANPTFDAEAFTKFVEDQVARWIEGNTQPPPLPERIENIDQRLVTPELEQAMIQQRLHKMLAQKNYSVFDVLSGNATVDILNELDPHGQWEMCRDDDDDNGYEDEAKL